MNIKQLITEIDAAKKEEGDMFDFQKVSYALREMRGILDDCAAIGMFTEAHNSGITHRDVCRRFKKFDGSLKIGKGE